MPVPSNATVTGVPVILTAIDQNGNSISIGLATSDMAGNFQYAWIPPQAGLYNIIATFAGTQSYGSSFATTGLTVGSPATTTTPTATQLGTVATESSLITYIAIAAIAIIITIIAATIVMIKFGRQK
jgi:hypothetical protein